MEAGKLNRRITIQRRSAGTDEAGGPSLTWEDVVSVWANVAGDSGLATIKAGGDVPAAVKRYSFRIRFREGLDEGMRVSYAGKVFDITGIRMDYARKESTELVCELGANDG